MMDDLKLSSEQERFGYIDFRFELMGNLCYLGDKPNLHWRRRFQSD